MSKRELQSLTKDSHCKKVATDNGQTVAEAIKDYNIHNINAQADILKRAMEYNASREGIERQQVQQLNTRFDYPLQLHKGPEIIDRVAWAGSESSESSNVLLAHPPEKEIPDLRITKKWKKVEAIHDNNRDEIGIGLIVIEECKEGDFILEYVGEAVENKQVCALNDTSYVMHIEGDFFVDATRRGGIARYIIHSLKPNCKIKKVKEMGCTRLAIFAGKDMPVGTEMTIDYGMTSMKSDFSLQQPFRWYHRRHLKPLFKKGENVYSAFWQNAKRNDNPQWFPGTIKSFREVDTDSPYGPTRYYDVKFDDGDEMDGVEDYYVFPHSDYELVMKNNFKNKWIGVKNVRDPNIDGEVGKWPRIVGWYVATLDGKESEYARLSGKCLWYDMWECHNMLRCFEHTSHHVFFITLLCSDAMDAYDNHIVQMMGKNTKRSELNRPMKFAWPLEKCDKRQGRRQLKNIPREPVQPNINYSPTIIQRFLKEVMSTSQTTFFSKNSGTDEERLPNCVRFGPDHVVQYVHSFRYTFFSDGKRKKNNSISCTFDDFCDEQREDIVTFFKRPKATKIYLHIPIEIEDQMIGVTAVLYRRILIVFNPCHTRHNEDVMKKVETIRNKLPEHLPSTSIRNKQSEPRFCTPHGGGPEWEVVHFTQWSRKDSDVHDCAILVAFWFECIARKAFATKKDALSKIRDLDDKSWEYLSERRKWIAFSLCVKRIASSTT